MQGWGTKGAGEMRMLASWARGDVVFTTTSLEGITYQIMRHIDGRYSIVADGQPLEALYWRAGELDRCAELVEHLAGTPRGTGAAAA